MIGKTRYDPDESADPDPEWVGKEADRRFEAAYQAMMTNTGTGCLRPGSTCSCSQGGNHEYPRLPTFRRGGEPNE